MPEPTVADLMSRHVITVDTDTPFRALVATMITHDLAAIPVIDTTGRPIGLVTEADVLTRLEFHSGDDHPTWLAGGPRRDRWRKSTALTAAQLMTTTALAVAADTPASAAERVMADQHRSDLCVVDRNYRLVGMLTRHHLLNLLFRRDRDIHADIERDVVGAIRPPDHVTVRVTDGVATLDGTVRLRSVVEHATHATLHVPGVITLHNNLRYDIDDLMITGL